VEIRQGRQGRKVDKEEKNCIAQEVFGVKTVRGNKPFTVWIDVAVLHYLQLLQLSGSPSPSMGEGARG